MEGKEHSISLKKAKAKGKTDIKKANRAIKDIRAYFQKHHRGKELVIAKEVNEEIWKHSNNIASRIVVQAIEKEGKVRVYLKDSEELKAEKEKAKKEAAKKAQPKDTSKKEPAEKAAAAEEKKPEEKEKAAKAKKEVADKSAEGKA